MNPTSATPATTEVPIRDFAKQATLMAVEMASGARPCRSLSNTFSDTAQHRLAVRAMTGGSPGQPSRFLSLRLITLPGDTYECVALLGFRPKGRVRVVALRIRRLAGQWQVVQVDVG